jgi:PAS domain S-box-containing protein
VEFESFASMWTKTAVARRNALWEYLTRPAASIQDEEQRHQVRLLAGMLLALLLVSLVVAPIWILSSPEFPATLPISVALVATLTSGLLLSRTRYHQIALCLLIGLFPGVVIATILTATGPMYERLLSLGFLIIGIMLVSILMSIRATVIFTLLCAVFALGFIFVPDVPFNNIYSFVVYITVTGALSVVAAVIRRTYAQRLNQNQQELNAFFNQSLSGCFFMEIDEPIHWNNPSDREALLKKVGAQMRVKRVNDAMLAQYGAEREQMLGMSFDDFFAHDQNQGRHVLSQLLDMGHLRIETHERKLDGTLLLIEGDYVCFRDQQGRVSGLFGVQRDVTERRQVEQALRQSEVRYRALFEQAHDTIFLTDLEGQHFEANSRSAALFGYSVEEMQHASVKQLSAEYDASMNVLQRLLDGEVLPIYERRFRKKNGEILTAEVNVELVRDSDGRPMHVQSVLRDITQRKQLEESLRASEARQRALLNALPDLMFHYHRDGTFLDYHAADASRLAVPPHLFLGRNISEVLPELAPLHMQHSNLALETGEEVTYEYSLPLNGEALYFEARLVASGPDEVTAIVRDVTLTKQAQQQAFNLALERARVKVLGQFIQTASHELRTPLAIVNTAVHLLARIPDDERRRRYAGQIEQQTLRLSQLIDMILTMAQLDSEIPFHQRADSINNLLRQVAAVVQQKAQPKRQTVQFEPDETLPNVCFDANWVAQAVNHVLDNATRFTPQGGSIHIRTYREGEMAVIAVQDTGIGISESALPHIFERFWRQDEAHSTPGFGLGLSIAQKIIELHNGRIEVDSVPGAGTIFRLLLPIE